VDHLGHLPLNEFGTLFRLPPVVPVEQAHVGLLLLIGEGLRVGIGGGGFGMGLLGSLVVLLGCEDGAEGALLQLLFLPQLLLLFPFLLILAVTVEVLPGLGRKEGTAESK
jgi:hypothetical protein